MQCDSNIAKQLFSAIFQGIFSQMDESLTDTEAEQTCKDIQGALNDMMTSSMHYFPPFISCIQVSGLRLVCNLVPRAFAILQRWSNHSEGPGSEVGRFAVMCCGHI